MQHPPEPTDVATSDQVLTAKLPQLLTALVALKVAGARIIELHLAPRGELDPLEQSFVALELGHGAFPQR